MRAEKSEYGSGRKSENGSEVSESARATTLKLQKLRTTLYRRPSPQL